MRKIAAVATASLVPDTVRHALALPANNATGTIRDVEHVVILMQENRSFDHYFGTLRGVRGYGDPRPVPLPGGADVFHQPVPGSNTPLLPFRLNTATTSAACLKSLDHSWKASQALWNNWDVWVEKKTAYTMGHLVRADIPYYYALADAFTICDAYHCSLFGPTDPNRLYLFSGTSGLAVGDDRAQAISNTDDDQNWTADMSLDEPDFGGFGWVTYADRLESAGISWQLYQEYDNFGDNSLAYFKQFRNLDRNSPRYRKARAIVPGSHAEHAMQTNGSPLVAAFANDVASGTLPQVSWIVAPTALSEHPDAPPGFGEVLISRLVDVLVAHPETWAKTVFIINYDENDGFFDHVPAPVPAHTPDTGHTMVSIHGELYGDVPVGLGPRVPMLIVSPWSKGGWVNSELFDHTSVLMFLERRFGVTAPNITPWRRAVVGDLTSAFDFTAPGTGKLAQLPPTTSYVAQVERACTLAAPVIPSGPHAAAQMPVQEAGQRPARALPYRLTVSAEATKGGLNLTFNNSGALGVTFLLYFDHDLRGPRHYTIAREASHTARIPLDGPEYGATLFGPNGFLRRFAGSAPDGGAEHLLVREQYDPAHDRLVLALVNRGANPLTVRITPGAYPNQPPQVHMLAPGATARSVWQIAGSDHWYDLSVRADELLQFERRYAGHMETGQPSWSDPAFGRVQA